MSQFEMLSTARLWPSTSSMAMKPHLRFALEASKPGGAAGEVLRQHLNGDITIQRRIACSVHLPHTACTEAVENLVVTYSSAKFNSATKTR